MDSVFLYRNQRFTWDREKASRNLVKHGIHFEQVCQVFFDPLAQVLDASTTSEPRESLIGTTANLDTLYVVHVWRDEEGIRIISAREATTTERRNYEDHD